MYLDLRLLDDLTNKHQFTVTLKRHMKVFHKDCSNKDPSANLKPTLEEWCLGLCLGLVPMSIIYVWY